MVYLGTGLFFLAVANIVGDIDILKVYLNVSVKISPFIRKHGQYKKKSKIFHFFATKLFAFCMISFFAFMTFFTESYGYDDVMVQIMNKTSK